MKIYKGTAKIKDNSTYVYKGHTLEITGVYMEYKNGKGMGVYADGSREYKLSLKGTKFEENYGTMSIIHDNHLENIELFETIELPLTEEETLQLIDFTSEQCYSLTNDKILEAFIKENTNQSVLPIPDLTTLYSEEEWKKRNNIK